MIEGTQVYSRSATHVAFFVPIAPRQKGNRKVIRKRPGRRGAWSDGAVAAALRGLGVTPPKPKGGLFVASNDADKAAEDALVHALRPLAPPEPWAGVIGMDVLFVYPVPGRFDAEQRRLALARTIRPTSTGYHHHDRGNVLKLLEDAMQAAGFYTNDSNVCEGPVSKVFGEVAGYAVTVKVLPDLQVCPRGAAKRKRKARA